MQAISHSRQRFSRFPQELQDEIEEFTFTATYAHRIITLGQDVFPSILHVSRRTHEKAARATYGSAKTFMVIGPDLDNWLSAIDPAHLEMIPKPHRRTNCGYATFSIQQNPLAVNRIHANAEQALLLEAIAEHMEMEAVPQEEAEPIMALTRTSEEVEEENKADQKMKRNLMMVYGLSLSSNIVISRRNVGSLP